MTTVTLPEPRIIPRSDHSISRTNIDREALKVMYRLRDAGYLAYLVGGGVRDLMLGREPKDFDISTDARPGELRKLFRNSRIIGKRFRLVQVFFHGGKIIEVSTFRCRSEFEENGNGDALLAQNNTFGSPAEDAFRRDLTINALFYEIEHFTVIDYTGGVQDLENRVVRMVGDPERRIMRDPVRMMRAIRHAARQGFSIEPHTWAAIRAHVDTLALCPVSRLRDEFMKDMRSGAMAAWARLALASNIFFILLPCYRGVVPGGEEVPYYEQAATGDNITLVLLEKLLGVVDAACRAGKTLADETIFALLLLPWAMSELKLLGRELKGGDAFRFTRRLREALDVDLEQLGIKRGSKETITLLLANLPLFVRHHKEKSWPRWLAKKGYFREGLLFFELYQAALSGGAVPDIAVPESAPPKTKKRRRGKRPGFRTAAVSTRKGGIFGLKK